MVKKVVKTVITETSSNKAKKKSNSNKTKKKAVKKKTAKKKATKKKSSKRKIKKKNTSKRKSTPNFGYTKDILKGFEKREELMVENFVGLQKAIANLSLKFSELSVNLNNLLGVFEIAAKTLAESEKQVDRTLSSKLDMLIEQNKSISNEISLVDSKAKKVSVGSQGSVVQQQPAQQSRQGNLYSRQIQPPASNQNQPPVSNQNQGGIPPKQLPGI